MNLGEMFPSIGNKVEDEEDLEEMELRVIQINIREEAEKALERL